MADFAAPQRAHARQAPRQQVLLHFGQQQQPGQGGPLHGGVVAGGAVSAQAAFRGYQDAYPVGQQGQQLGQVFFGHDEGDEIVDLAVAAQLVGHALQGVAVALHLVAVHEMLGDVHHIGAGGAGGQLIDAHPTREQWVEQGADGGVIHSGLKNKGMAASIAANYQFLIFYLYI